MRLQVSCDVVFTNRWVPAKSIITSSSIEVGNCNILCIPYNVNSAEARFASALEVTKGEAIPKILLPCQTDDMI